MSGRRKSVSVDEGRDALSVDEILELMPKFASMTESQARDADRAAEDDARRAEDERQSSRYRILMDMGVSRGEFLDVEPQFSQPRELLRLALQGHRLNRRSRSRGLIVVLQGDNGLGKSFAAVQWLYRATGRPYYATAAQLVAFSDENHQKKAPPWDRQVYVLDQMGHERRSDRMSEFFNEILRQGSVMVATTDLSAPVFRERYQGHIADRVDEMRPGLPHGGLIACEGKSWRTGNI